MKLQKYLLFTALYIAIMAVGMAIMYYGFGIEYGSPGMANVVIFTEIVLSLLVLYYIRRYASWRAVGFGEFKWVRVLWIAPILLLQLISFVIVLITIASSSPGSRELLGVLLVGVMTLLVGFSEETMFRGILLRGAMTRTNVFLAMLISAVGFSLLHGVNILGGEPANLVLSQMVDTLLYGLFMAPMAILVGNLIPLILAHFLWDFNVLALGQLASVDTMSGVSALVQGVTVPVQYLLMIVAWMVIIVRWRRGVYRQETTRSDAS